MGITIFKFFIWGGISSDIRLDIKFYVEALSPKSMTDVTQCHKNVLNLISVLIKQVLLFAGHTCESAQHKSAYFSNWCVYWCYMGWHSCHSAVMSQAYQLFTHLTYIQVQTGKVANL